MRAIAYHIAQPTIKNILVYGDFDTNATFISEWFLSAFPTLNFVSYWGATTGDIGTGNQCVRKDSPTVIVVTSAATTGFDLPDIGMVIATQIRAPCELMRLAGLASRSPDGVECPVPVIVNFEETAVRRLTFSTSLRQSLQLIQSTPSTCITAQLQSLMVPPSNGQSGSSCGACAGCDQAYAQEVASWLPNVDKDEEMDAQALQEPVRDFLLEAVQQVELEDDY